MIETGFLDVDGGEVLVVAGTLDTASGEGTTRRRTTHATASRIYDLGGSTLHTRTLTTA